MKPTDVNLRRWGRGAGLLAALGLLTVGVSQAYWEGFNPWERNESGEYLYAIRAPNIYYHNVGLLEVMVTNVGVIGNPNFVDSFGAGWKGGEYLYAASLWFGAVASDNLQYVSTGAYDYELRPSLDPIDTIYGAFEGATGGDRPGFSSNGGDDDGDGLINEDPLNGKDDDLDGLIDEDFAAISQQMYSCEYWDYTDEVIAQYSDHRPLYIKVKQQSMAWSTQGANEFTGFEYTIVNDGFESLRQIYLGYFVDSDAGEKEAPGYWSDDGGELRSLDTTYVDNTIRYECGDESRKSCAELDLHLDIAYMRDTPGSEPGGNAADDMGAGANGFFGGMFLGHTTDPLGERAPTQVQIHTCHFFSGSGTYPDGDPRNDFERYDLLARGTRPRRPTSQPNDYRYAFSAGPFSELLPGEELKIQVAFVIGNEWQGLLHNAITAQRIYNGAWKDTDGNPKTGCAGLETCLRIEPGSERLQWNNPCDSLLPAEMISNTTCNPDGVTNWVDQDCNCCTPIQPTELSCNGDETLMHWVWTVAPPPPLVSTEDPTMRSRVEGDQSIKLEWDNASELVADPGRQMILFRGYRIWRVEGWERPIGSTGPTPSEWQLIADLSLDPIGSQLPLSNYTNEYATVVEYIPSPVDPNAELAHYAVGRYEYTDILGLKNGMIYFYDVTAYSAWNDESTGVYMELSSQPAASEAEGVRPISAAITDGTWMDELRVIPNPWRGGAGWDLTPSSADPTGTMLRFAGLPDSECDIRIYTLSGDLVQTLNHDGSGGRGAVSWNMITRNGQDIVSGVYLYAVKCGSDSKVGRFTVIR